MAFVAVSGIGIVLVNLAVYMILGWDVEAICPGDAQFCADVWWTTIVDQLAQFLFVGLMLVVLAHASPWALIRA